MKKKLYIILLIFLFSGLVFIQYAKADSNVVLTKVSGDKQHGVLENKISDPLIVKALDNNKEPLENIKIVFNLVSRPSKSKNSKILNKVVYTDKKGEAETGFILGSKQGKYIITATSPDSEMALTFKLTGNSATWLVFIAFGLLGGLGLFLYGMDFMGDGLQKWAGDKMRAILGTLTKNRVMGLLLGLFVTAIIQSSSATTVMLVGFTNATLMTLQQTIGVILGADIGTTATAQLVAFKLTKFSLGFIGVGFLFLFLGKTQRYKYIGQVIMGFGILFFGMKVMSDTLKPLRALPFFINILSTMENPFMALLVSTIFTAIVQSSSATTGIIITLSLQGIINLEMAIPLIFGANIGTCITAGIASIGASREAKQVALAHVTFKIVGVAIFFWLMSPLAHIVRSMSIFFTSATAATVNNIEYVPRQIANAHMVFNVLMALLFIPFTKYFARLIARVLPDVKEKEVIFKPKYIDRNILTLDDSSLALLQTRKEVLRMADSVRKMIDKCEVVLSHKSKEELDELILEDQKVDVLYKAVKPYLGLIIQKGLGKDDSLLFTEVAYTAEELETMGDLISKSIAATINKVILKEIYFHDSDWNHIKEFHKKVKANYSNVIKSFEENNFKRAEKVIKTRKELQILYKALQISHLQKFQEQFKDTIEYSSEYLSILSDFRDLFYMSTNIAYAVIEYFEEKDYLER